jgi:hypothetical protein
MARHANPTIQLERIRLICQFLSNGGGTKADMVDYVNEEMTANGHAAVKLRTIEYDLEKLNSGEFEHAEMHLKKSELGKLFRYKTTGKYYTWAEDSKIPVFDDLNEAERLTLPFLFGILQQYQGLPAIQKILDTLDEKYRITPEEYASSTAFFVQRPTMTSNTFGTEVVQLVLKVIGHIQRNEVIEFHYAWVGNLDAGMNTYSEHKIAPMQVRLYEHYYYLTGIDIEKDRIVNYRMDQIKRLRIDTACDENGEIESFDKKKFEKKYRLDRHFKNVLGVWNHHPSDDLHRITIEFRDWAASYAKPLQFHPSQRLVRMDVEARTLTITLDLLLFPEIVNDKKVHERSPELAFLLGRFRECARIVSMEQIK